MNLNCIIKSDDERRRPISRAYVGTLTDRVSMLENMLKDQGAEVPGVIYPPRTTKGNTNPDDDRSPARRAAHRTPPSNLAGEANDDSVMERHSPDSVVDGTMEECDDGGGTAMQDGHADQEECHIVGPASGTPIEDKSQGLVSRLLSTRGHLSFDQISGRLRYFGPTVNSHIYSKLDVDDAKTSREAAEQARRAEKIIRTLRFDSHDYLMDLFWQHYNGVLHVVHKQAFDDDRENGGTQFYSGFLHICILAMGYRFADKTREDMQRISLPDRESTLHREAKYMLDLELERPGGIPSVAALLILGDSEVGVGRDNVGWMYAGMAMRLAYDIGLHLDSSHSGMSEREVDVRRMTLWACVIYDRYWSLFLGRPTTIKSADVEIYSLAIQFERLGTCKPAGPDKCMNTRIYEALIDLMEIAGKIVESPEYRKEGDALQNPDQSSYLKMMRIDRELHNWAQKLPLAMRYTEENRVSAPYSFYLLHQQYNAVQILLHRPFARYDDPGENDSDDSDISALDRHFSAASRAICTKAAVTIARIFWQHRQRFDGKQIFCIGMQHAGTAATALIAALALIPDTTDRNNNLQYLEVLHSAIQDMAHGYQPAERMASVLDAVMIELRGGPISPGGAARSHSSSIPARRDSTVLYADVERPMVKRRHAAETKKPRATRPLATTARQHRPSDASNRSNTSPQVRHRPSAPDAPANVHPGPLLRPAQKPQISIGSNGSNSCNIPMHQIQQPNDFDMITSQMHNEPVHSGNTYEAGDHSNMFFAMRNDGTALDLGNQDFPTMPAMNDLPKVSDTDIAGFDFMSLPTQDDWDRWHANSNDQVVDLDGFPPRKRTQIHNFTSPPMGEIMSG